MVKEQSLKAIKILYDKLNFENPDILNDIENDYLIEYKMRNGRNVIWYLDNGVDIAIYTDTYDFVTKEEMDNEFY